MAEKNRRTRTTGTDKNVFKDEYFEDLDFNILTKEEKEKYGSNFGKGRKSADMINKAGRSNKDGRSNKAGVNHSDKLIQTVKSNPTERISNRHPGHNAATSGKLDYKAGQRLKSAEKADKRNHSMESRLTTTKVSGKLSNKGTCPYIRDCGGCNILNQSYEDELKEKQKMVEKLLNKYCKTESMI